MRPIHVLGDVELAALHYLSAAPAVTDLVPPERITTEIPANDTLEVPVLLVARGPSQSADGFVEDAPVQLDALARHRRDASKLIRTAVAVLLAAGSDPTPHGVVQCCEVEVGPQWIPDLTWTPPMPRFSARVLVHITSP